jgi:hypothetical protein
MHDVKFKTHSTSIHKEDVINKTWQRTLTAVITPSNAFTRVNSNKCGLMRPNVNSRRCTHLKSLRLLPWAHITYHVYFVTAFVPVYIELSCNTQSSTREYQNPQMDMIIRPNHEVPFSISLAASLKKFFSQTSFCHTLDAGSYCSHVITHTR